MSKLRKNISIIITLLVLSLAAALLGGRQAEPIGDLGLQLTFLDVGQGDAAFIRTPNGETWLIDGGEDKMYESELLPFLNLNSVDALDFAVVTHYHNDHMGGIFQLLRSGRIKTLILPDYVPDSKAKTGLLKAAEVAHTAVLDVSAGDVLEASDKDLRLSVLHPEKGGFDIKNENSNSLVIRLDYLGTSALLTGDLEEDAEKVLLSRQDLEVDILKLGHHGSSTSTCEEFLKATNPTYAIVSAGYGNSYGHPHYEVTDRLENDDVQILSTITDGDITFYLAEHGIAKISTEE